MTDPTPFDPAAAAARLAGLRRSRHRFADLGPGGPRTEDEGYRVQAELHRLLAADPDHGPVVGFKIGCTSAVMQQLLGLPGPCAGGVYRRRLHTGPEVRLRSADFVRLGVECELAVRLRPELPPPTSPTSVADAAALVQTCAAAIELVDDRYLDLFATPAPVLIADDFAGGGLVLGPEDPGFDPLTLDRVAGELLLDGEQAGSGVGADLLGHPLAALAWLVDRRAALGSPLAGGEVVTLGSLVPPVWLDRPARVEVRMAGLGPAVLEVAPG